MAKVGCFGGEGVTGGIAYFWSTSFPLSIINNLLHIKHDCF